MQLNRLVLCTFASSLHPAHTTCKSAAWIQPAFHYTRLQQPTSHLYVYRLRGYENVIQSKERDRYDNELYIFSTFYAVATVFLFLTVVIVLIVFSLPYPWDCWTYAVSYHIITRGHAHVKIKVFSDHCWPPHWRVGNFRQLLLSSNLCLLAPRFITKLHSLSLTNAKIYCAIIQNNKDIKISLSYDYPQCIWRLAKNATTLDTNKKITGYLLIQEWLLISSYGFSSQRNGLCPNETCKKS